MTAPRRIDARHNRDLVLEAARRLLRAGGPELSLNQVAAEAGVGVATVYRNFPTTLDLLRALAEPHLDELAAFVRALTRDDDAGAFERAFRAAVDLFGAHAELLRVVANGASDTTTPSAHVGPVALALAALLERAVARGEIRSDITVEVVQHLVCAVDYAARLSTGPDARRVHTDIALRGVQPPSRRSAAAGGPPSRWDAASFP